MKKITSNFVNSLQDDEEDKENKNKDLEKAVAHKNKLLEFDKNW